MSTKKESSDKPTAKRSRRRLYEEPADAAPVPEEAPSLAAVEPEPGEGDKAQAAVEEADAGAGGRRENAERLLRRYVGYTAAGGLIPIPLADMAAVTAVQVKFLQELSEIYGVPFSDFALKSVVAVLTGGLGMAHLARTAFSTGIKLIPGLGTSLGMASYSATSSALTYALGKVFIKHYELGGTLLDFDPDKTKNFFAEQFRAGRLGAAEVTPAG